MLPPLRQHGEYAEYVTKQLSQIPVPKVYTDVVGKLALAPGGDGISYHRLCQSVRWRWKI
jgi:hypothetical protein